MSARRRDREAEAERAAAREWSRRLLRAAIRRGEALHHDDMTHAAEAAIARALEGLRRAFPGEEPQHGTHPNAHGLALAVVEDLAAAFRAAAAEADAAAHAATDDDAGAILRGMLTGSAGGIAGTAERKAERRNRIAEARDMLAKGASRAEVCRRLEIKPDTLRRYLRPA